MITEDADWLPAGGTPPRVICTATNIATASSWPTSDENTAGVLHGDASASTVRLGTVTPPFHLV